MGLRVEMNEDAKGKEMEKKKIFVHTRAIYILAPRERKLSWGGGHERKSAPSNPHRTWMH